MTKSSILSLAAALVAASISFAPAAQANGMRLNFGGPIGSFVAHPTPGYGGSSSYGSKAKCAKKAPSQQVARHSVEKTERTKVAKKVERDEPRVAKVHAKPARTQVASIERTEKKAKVEADTTPVTTATETTTTSNASQSLAAGALPAAETIAAEPAPEAVVAETQDTIEPVQTETVKTASIETTAAAKECKKFIPAVGVTVTVGCDK